MRPTTLLTLLAFFIGSATFAQSSGKKAISFFDDAKTSSRNSSAAPYTLTTLNESYTNLVNPISVNNDELWDDPEYIIPVDFPFELNGHEISSLQFGASGFLLLAPTSDPEVSTVVFPFEMDLIDRGVIADDSQSPISYLVEGDPGNRILKIEINNAGSYTEFSAGTQDMYINIQLWLYEGSHQIEFRFGERFIDDPDLFYDGFGTYIGISDINVNSGDVSNANFFEGDIDAPVLVNSDITIEGTPAEGTVYRLSMTLQLDVTISSMNSTSTCAPNGEATAVANSGAAPYTYLWSNGETTATITNLDAGTYTVTVTDFGGETGTASVVITNVDPIDPNAMATGETSQDANDGTATSAPSGGDGMYAFAWSNGETTSTITGLAPGVYTVTVTDAEGCTAEESVIVNAFECMGLQINVQVLNTSCFGSCDGAIEVIEVIGGTAPYTYSWSNGANTITITDLCAGSYSITIVDAAGCEVSDIFFVDDADEFFVNAGATSETGVDQNDGTAWASPSGDFGPFTYEWSNMSTDSLITNLTPGVYSVTVTNSNGCIAVESIEVFPFICFGEIGFNTIKPTCPGECDGVITAIIINGGIGPFSFLWNNGSTSSSIGSLCAGEYEVTITDEGQGCTIEGSTAIADPTPLFIIAEGIIHVTDTTTGSIFITTTGGTLPYSYVWTGPNGYSSTDEDIADLEPGLYTVIATDFFGCTRIITVEIQNQTVGIFTPYNLDVKIYPNPVSDFLQIELADNLADFKVELISPDGRTFATWKNEKSLDMSGYTPGMYFLKCTSGDKYFVHRFNIIR